MSSIITQFLDSESRTPQKINRPRKPRPSLPDFLLAYRVNARAALARDAENHERLNQGRVVPFNSAPQVQPRGDRRAA
jgi:hypothetical protein